MMATISEVVAGAETIRAYDAGARFGGTADDAIDQPHVGAQIRGALIGAFLFPSGEVFSVLTVAARRSSSG